MIAGNYICRFCGREMEQTGNSKEMKKGKYKLADVVFWKCKHCGIYFIEILRNYNKETTKKILKC